MSFWRLERFPEPEEMDADDEVASYTSAAAGKHLDAIDDTFVEHLHRILPAKAAQGAWALDVGSGPAQIPTKILGRVPGLRFVALDRFPNMLNAARENAGRAGVAGRLTLLRSDGQLLPFADHTFAVVICNSVLHHARNPVELLKEIFRVAATDGVILIRDLRRPSRPLLRWHLWRHGRRYRGTMRQLFNASVRAAYTEDELRRMLFSLNESNARVFRYQGAHIGIERGH